jgi:hypothetical protein
MTWQLSTIKIWETLLNKGEAFKASKGSPINIALVTQSTVTPLWGRIIATLWGGGLPINQLVCQQIKDCGILICSPVIHVNIWYYFAPIYSFEPNSITVYLYWMPSKPFMPRFHFYLSRIYERWTWQTQISPSLRFSE